MKTHVFTLLIIIYTTPAAPTTQAQSFGTVVAWGRNEERQSDVPVAAQSGVAAIAAGIEHTVALKNDQTVLAWGGDDYGRMTVLAPAQSGVMAVAAGGYHTVALKNNGSVLVWGRNIEGQTIVPVSAQSGVTAIAAGVYHTVALKNGNVVAWGRNVEGQTSVPTAAQSGVTAIAAGWFHTAALKNDGSVVAWGGNDFGQATVPVSAQSGVTAIAAGGNNTVALKNDASVMAWGRNVEGQTTVPVAAQRGVIAIAAGVHHAVALKNDGTMVVWGFDCCGETTVPPRLNGLTAIAAGWYHTVALLGTTYKALYVFGSSWADTQHGPTDSARYWQGHWSNGTMWPEVLSTNLGLAYVRKNNFAVGASQSDIVLSQVTNFTPPANPELCLYHFWAGYTDFRNSADNLSNDLIWRSRTSSKVANISNAVLRLYEKGARSILVPNVFDRSREPWSIRRFGANSADQLLFRQRTTEFNAALAIAIENIDHAKPDLRLYTLNMQSKMDELNTNASFYGFTKTFPGAIEDASIIDQSFTGPGQDYLYWDQQHATSKAHAYMAAWNLEAITNSTLERLTISAVTNVLSLRMNKLLIGRAYTLQRSSSLASWQDIHTFTASAGTNEWVVPIQEMSPAFLRLNWTR